MTALPSTPAQEPRRQLRKPVTLIAIRAIEGSLTHHGRLTYNAMIQLAQSMTPDEEGGYKVALSQILAAFDCDANSSPRIAGYIDAMVTTPVRWYALSPADAESAYLQIEKVPLQPQLEGMPSQTGSSDDEERRVFTMLSEARFVKRGGQWWLTYYFPPSIRELLRNPARWALVDLIEQSKCTTYASGVLYEICSRYRDVPGGRTNRETPEWWTNTLRGHPDSKPREWRKVKNEIVLPAIDEINRKTSLHVELMEHRQGRAVTAVQFAVSTKSVARIAQSQNLDLVDRGEKLEIAEKDIDALVDTYGRVRVELALTALENRLGSQPLQPIGYRRAYLEKIIKSDKGAGPLFAAGDDLRGPKRRQPGAAASTTPMVEEVTSEQLSAEAETRAARVLARELDQLPDSELARYADIARQRLRPDSLFDQSLLKRFAARQYRSPLIWKLIVEAYAVAVYGDGWVDKVNEAFPESVDQEA